jgi:alpha-mannosidase
MQSIRLNQLLSRARQCAIFMALPSFLLPLVVTGRAQNSDQVPIAGQSQQPTLYVVGYAHLDTEWRWEYPQVIDEYLRKTMEDNFKLFDKYPHYVFNFSGSNRYRFMKEYFPADYARLKQYVEQGRWYPAGSSVEEGDVNAPSAEAIIRQILYGNDWFRAEFGKASAEYMLPDCFGFPASLPTILAHAGVKGFSTQKLVWGSSAAAGGPQSLEDTPEGTPFNVGIWVGPDGERILAALNPGSYGSRITTDLSKPLPPLPTSPVFADLQKKIGEAQQKLQQEQLSGKPVDPKDVQAFLDLHDEQDALVSEQHNRARQRFQGDWAARVLQNGKLTGLFADYHYVGTGDIGGAPDENSVKLLEALVTQGNAILPQGSRFSFGDAQPAGPAVKVGDGPVRVISSPADQMFLAITPAQAANLPRYTGEMELTNHSAGSLTSQAYQKRWIRHEELLADAAEKSSVAAAWLGSRPYPLQRLNDAWTLAMGAHFHDLAAGTATPRSYEFAWNDDVIAMNQFAGVLTNASEAVAAALDTETKGTPLVLFNPLNIERADVVEASLDFPGGMPKAVRVTDPEGKDVPAQISNGKVVFVAKVPSVGYAVYDVEPATEQAATGSTLHVSKQELENDFYRVALNDDGDVASIFDKQIGKELLSAPARLAISYDNPAQWPAWNMDWEQEQAKPTAFVGGPAKMRVVEDGPVRVAIEVSRETAGSRFVQTISVAAGEAGKHVEFGNVIDWNTRESNLKATFPLTASNELATYNLDIGTIDRPTAAPKKFEVVSHQWVDLTDMSGKFGVTILTDSKNGSDKPDDQTIRLTLIRTPGIAGGYADQATQDIGHHEFVYGIAGHAAGWREGETYWQAERLNAPIIAFATAKHAGAQGRKFSLVKVNSPHVRILAVKKAEKSDETIVRLVELDGKPQPDVQVSFAAATVSAREVNGQEQPVGAATVNAGVLTTSLGAYQPRTFALHLAPPTAVEREVQSTPVTLPYDVATASNDGDASRGGFDGNGNALPAEALPAQIDFDDVRFQLVASKAGTANAVTAKGQQITLPAGHYNRVYVLAASAGGDQSVVFEAGSSKAEVKIQDWSGFIGQWDDRIWSSQDTAHDNYGEMIGLKPGFIKRADLAWFSDHHHDASGHNVAYAYSYLFAYAIDLPAGAKTIKLPHNDKVRILAISLANDNPEVKPVHPLYDVLPSPNAGPSDFTLSISSNGISIPQGKTEKTRIIAMPRGSFDGRVNLSATGLPAGVTAAFTPASTTGASTLTLTTSRTTAPATATVTITGASGSLTHTASTTVTVTPILIGTVPVALSSAYNVTGIYKDGSTFKEAASLDQGGYAFSADLLGSEQVGANVVFKLGPANAPDVVTGKTVTLPAGKYSSVKILAVAVDGDQEMQTFSVNYADGETSTFTQSLSDWASPGRFKGESVAAEMPYRVAGDNSKDGSPFYLHAYSFGLNKDKMLKSITLPSNRQVLVFAITLVP